MSDKNIQVGAYGWLHAHWQSVFYPDDMPPEWCLAYYSNEFNAVMVPADYWRKAEGFDCEQWLDDIHDEFRFYVECPVQVLSDDEMFNLFLQQLDYLSSHLAGVFLPKQVTKPVNLSRLQRISQQTILFCQAGIVGLDTQVVWQEDFPENKVSAQLAIFEDDLTQLRRTRLNVEAFTKKNSVGRAQDIIIKHKTLSASNLMKFRSVIEIMGL